MPISKGAYKWWAVAMLWFVCFFNYADRQAIFSVFPLLKSEMGLSDVHGSGCGPGIIGAGCVIDSGAASKRDFAAGCVAGRVTSPFGLLAPAETRRAAGSRL
jgi:hypothetical protein